MTPTEQAAKITEIKKNTNIVYSGKLDAVGHESVAWECRNDAGEPGWMIGTFDTFVGAPYCPMLSCEVWFTNRADAVSALNNQ